MGRVRAMGLALVVGACAPTGDNEHEPLGQSEQATTCGIQLEYYPVSGPHNTGYDSTAGNSSLWSCDDAYSNSDFVAGDHLGNDIWAAEGTPVVATVSGTLTLVGWSNYSGNKVTIIDSCGWYHFYCHLSGFGPGIEGANGAAVSAGDVIGYVGKTGTESNGVVHLHYSIYPDGNYSAGVDPWPHLHAVEHNVCGDQQPAGANGDVNGDGRADLVSVHEDGQAWVWTGAADGTFGSGVASFDGSLDAANVDGEGHYIAGVADVTGDGRADLVSARDGNAWVWPGEDGGTFGSAVSSFDGSLDAANIDGDGHFIVGVADVTGDGKADLVAVNVGDAWVWPGQDDGTFGSAVSSFDGTLDAANVDGTGHYIVGVADVTGDRKADLVSAGGDGNAWVWPGQDDGTFGTAVPSFGGTLDAANVDGTGHYIVGVADVTGDRRADLVSARDDGNAWVWPGMSDGSFGTAVPSFGGTLDAANVDGTGHYIVGVADVTGDRKADLVSARDDGNAWVWPGMSDGSFGTAVPSFGGTLDAANVDGTGHFIVAPSGPDTTAFVPGSGEGSSGAGAGSPAPGGDVPSATEESDGGCSYTRARKSSSWAALMLLGLFATAVQRRRSRAQRCRVSAGTLNQSLSRPLK